jgi:hypothetical protein
MEKGLVTANVCLMMNSTERKYGFITFPDTGERIENVWLNITDREIFLEVPFSINKDFNFPIVLGVFNGLDNATFVNVFTSGGTRGGGGSVRKLVVSWMIKGKHVKSFDQLKFKTVAFNEFALKDWFREDFSIERKNFTYSLPDPIQPLIVKTKNFALTWEIAHRINFNFEDVDIKLTSRIISIFNQKQNWDVIVNHILRVKKLLIFLTNKDPKIDNIFLGDHIELIFRTLPLFESRFPTSISLDYKETKPLLPEIVSTWFDNDKLEPITDLVLEKHFHDGIPLHRHFFNIAVGLEAFHEQFILKKVPLSDHSIITNKSKIEQAIVSNEELNAWFKSMSSNWVKPSLKDRLIHMQDTIANVSDGVFSFNTLELITRIKKTRDEIAHAGIYDKQFKEDIELRIATKIIEFVLRLEIYKMLQIDWKSNRTDMIKEANTMVKRLAIMNDFKIATTK